MVCKLFSMAITQSSIIFQFTITYRFLNSYLNTHSIFHHTIFFKNVKVSRLVKKKCHTAESSMISPSRVLLHRVSRLCPLLQPIGELANHFKSLQVLSSSGEPHNYATNTRPSCVTDRLAKQSVQPNPSTATAHFVFCRILQNFIL